MLSMSYKIIIYYQINIYSVLIYYEAILQVIP